MIREKQKARIITYLREHKCITPMVAFGELGITKLATRVGELIEDGYDIRKEWVTDVNRFGERVRYMRYFLAA